MLINMCPNFMSAYRGLTPVQHSVLIVSQMRKHQQCFQPGEGPSMSLLRDCEIFANLRLKLYWWPWSLLLSNCLPRCAPLLHCARLQPKQFPLHESHWQYWHTGHHWSQHSIQISRYLSSPPSALCSTPAATFHATINIRFQLDINQLTIAAVLCMGTTMMLREIYLSA